MDLGSAIIFIMQGTLETYKMVKTLEILAWVLTGLGGVSFLLSLAAIIVGLRRGKG